jgi:pilus assembly protein Flp/PilA
MTKFVTRFVRDESGATAIEYGLIAALIAVALLSALQLLGSKIGNTFNGIGNNMP